MSLRTRLSAPVLGALVAAGLPGPVGAAEAKSAVYTFGTLKTPTADAVRAQARAWLEGTGYTDAAAFAAVWEADKPLLDRVTDTLALGDAAAAKLLAEARDPAAPAAKEVPALLRDAKLPAF